jgi:hypothetical protein
MSEHDTKTGDEHAHQSLAVALTDLADTMPDDPFRVDGVHTKVRRRRNRRRATRTVGAVVVGAATIAALVAVRPGPTHVSTVPASQPSATTSPLSCAAALAAAPDAAAVPEPKPGASVTDVAADAAKRAAADGASAATSADSARRAVKGLGTIVSVADTSVTITVTEPIADEPNEITATVSADAKFMDGASVVGVRPALNTGDPVAFAASHAADGSYQIIYLAVHVEEPNTSTTDAGAVDQSSNLKATAQVVAVEAGALTLMLRDGPLANQTVNVATGPDTVYIAGNQKCVDPTLTAGDEVGVLLVKGSDGTYTVQALALPSPAAAKP